MLRFSILLVLLTNPTRPARVADPPSFADRLGKLYKKLEGITVAPPPAEDKLYEKLNILNALSPDKFELSDENEELLSAMQSWVKMTPEQLDQVVKDLQELPEDSDEEKSERMTEQEYADSEWNDEFQDIIPEGDYPNDKDWDVDNEVDATAKPILGITPSAFTRIDLGYRKTVISAVNPIAATNERPRLLDDSGLTTSERALLRREVMANIRKIMREKKCLIPQSRWITVSDVAPAADTIYVPPCVQLHRCAPDTGCCDRSGEVCAPIAGNHVPIPFQLYKADGTSKVARLQFFNHTQCGCVSKRTLQSTVSARLERRYDSDESRSDLSSEGQNDWRPPTEEPKLDGDDSSEPPQLRRCTCPTLFLASMPESGQCSCVCEWPEPIRRRDCLSFARGREHFGLRDRFCVDRGDCTPPTCEYGAYDRQNGLCPLRRYRKSRYHSRPRYMLEKPVVM